MSGTKDKRQKRPFPEDPEEGHTQPIDDPKWDTHSNRSEIALGWEQRGASKHYGHLVRTSQMVVVHGECTRKGFLEEVMSNLYLPEEKQESGCEPATLAWSRPLLVILVASH